MCFNPLHNHETPKTVTTDTSKMERRGLLQGLAAGGAVVAATGLSGCVTNSETGRSQLVGFAPGNASLSQQAAASWSALKQQTPTSNDPRYTARLKNIGGRVSQGANRADQDWDYAVFNSTQRNAFVLPGNRVGFYTGMMDFADNDDQIAGIMGHEVGHVARSHARERLSQQIAGQLAVVGGTVLGGAALGSRCNNATTTTERNACQQNVGRQTQMINQALGLGFALGVTLPYSRRHETESDLLGANYMQRAGYDPYESVKLWEKMAETDQNRGPEFLSTHPDPANRARTLHAFIKRQESLGSQGFQSIRS
ncbi:MAG: M48 family metallopeptidase [Litorimonas sp.]